MESKSELTVVTKAKDLCSYIITITQKSPKQFRFTFVTRLQNLALDVIEKIYYANEVFISKSNPKNAEKRLALQHHALTTLKLVAYISELAMKEKCIYYQEIKGENASSPLQNLKKLSTPLEAQTNWDYFSLLRSNRSTC